MTRKPGRDLQVGDVITIWTRRDRITKLEPYVGTLANLWNGEACIATFAISPTGLTIDPDQVYEVY